MSDLQTIPDLTADFIRRVVTYTGEVTFFGANGVAGSLAVATAQQGATAEALYRQLLRRDTLLGATGDHLERVAEEYGAPRLGPSRAQVLVVIRSHKATVTAITSASLIEVDDSSNFAATDSIRLTTDDGSLSEILTISSITSGTGPNGGDELNVGLIVNTYNPTTTVVKVLLRKTLQAGTVFTSSAGVAFESLDDVTTGDANPALAGESVGLALSDKVLCEAQTPGIAGNIDALTITGLQTPDADIRNVNNPERGRGGEEEESEFALKYRASHLPQRGARDTPAFLEALARLGNNAVVRAFPEASSTISTIRIRVLTRSGGGLNANARDALGRFISDRMRSQLTCEVRNVVLTAIEVTADVTLDPGTLTALERLTAAWRLAADALSIFLDWRKWPEAQTVDEADLLGIVNDTEGIASVTTSSFTPSADTTVAAASVPILTRLVLTDVVSGETFGADLATTY